MPARYSWPGRTIAPKAESTERVDPGRTFNFVCPQFSQLLSFFFPFLSSCLSSLSFSSRLLSSFLPCIFISSLFLLDPKTEPSLFPGTPSSPPFQYFFFLLLATTSLSPERTLLFKWAHIHCHPHLERCQQEATHKQDRVSSRQPTQPTTTTASTLQLQKQKAQACPRSRRMPVNSKHWQGV